MVTVAIIEQRVAFITERMTRAALRAGRRPEEIKLMAVTKNMPAEVVRLAIQAGMRLFGESRVQEAASKLEALSGALPAGAPEFHLIGHLQRNKARQAAEIFDWVQSIEKTATARELDKWAARAGKTINILLEVNTSGEESKYGFRSENELLACAEAIQDLTHLRLRGLMTIGPFTTEQEKIRAAFKKLAVLQEQLKTDYPQLALDTLSMGMSSDFELAIEAGSTLVRIGTALFGERESK